MKKILLTISIMAFFLVGKAQQSVTGKWITIDDETGKKKSIVEIYEIGGELKGEVVKLFLTEEEDQNPRCTECEDERKGQFILGMKVLNNMKFDSEENEWSDGEILDPENGTTYDCRLWIEGNKLKVRGYVAFFYRTQTWERLKTN